MTAHLHLPTDAERVQAQEALERLQHVLPHWKVGTHRRVRLKDVLVFRERREQGRQQALQELADLDQELGML